MDGSRERGRDKAGLGEDRGRGHEMAQNGEGERQGGEEEGEIHQRIPKEEEGGQDSGQEGGRDESKDPAENTRGEGGRNRMN